MSEKLDIITLGEALIELSSDKSFKDTTCFEKYFGGDAIATAICASRMGSKVGFITCVGNDAFKDFLLDAWKAENLNIDCVKEVDDQNGVVLISRHDGYPKEIACYRKKTGSTKISIDNIKEYYIKNTKYFYTTGIAQSLSISANEAVKTCYKIAKENNVITAYDPNYKPSITSAEVAKENFEDIISDVDILFLSGKNDVANLLETDSIENVIKYCWDLGVQIIVVKSTKDFGYYTGYKGDIIFCRYSEEHIVDTTCSGDVFNGAFLNALTNGSTPFEATKFASVVSGLQAQNVGAIKSIPSRETVVKKLKEAEDK